MGWLFHSGFDARLRCLELLSGSYI
jgi:hypothetical protein